jgi:SAM-dependent methyltransferase/glycosyltransferase involved in cell wall biosynthesis
MVNLIEFLRESGWEVTFVSDHPGRPEDRRRLNQLGVPTFVGQDLDSLLRSNRFTLAMLAFWSHAERLLPRVRALSPETRVVIDSIDLHFVRAARERFEQLDGADSTLDEAYGVDIVRELNVYGRADAVLAVSEKEAALISDLSNGRVSAFCVPDCEDSSVFAPSDEDREGVVFVGNFRHPPNRDGVEYLCKGIVPRVPHELLRENTISVVGHALHGDALAHCERTDGVRAVGWVPSVVPYLKRAKVSLVPLRYGAGTKRKLIQAMMVGTPTVATPVAVEGIDVHHGQGVWIADGPAEFADALSVLLRDGGQREQLRGGGQEAVAANHGRERVGTCFAEALAAIIAGDRHPRLGGETPHDTAPSEASRTETPHDPSPSDVMKREWDERARQNAMHFIASGKREWEEAEFFASGRRNVEQHVLSDLERICRGRDPRQMRALEIGCGIGRMSRHLADVFGEVHGVDVSGEMIAEGRRKLAGVPNVYLHETGGSDLAPFDDGLFEFAFSFIVFQHIPYRDAIVSYFREVHRTLKPGCLFKFQVQGGKIARPTTWLGVGFSEDEMTQLAGDLGFETLDASGQGTQYFWNWWLRR